MISGLVVLTIINKIKYKFILIIIEIENWVKISGKNGKSSSQLIV